MSYRPEVVGYIKNGEILKDTSHVCTNGTLRVLDVDTLKGVRNLEIEKYDDGWQFFVSGKTHYKTDRRAMEYVLEHLLEWELDAIAVSEAEEEV